MSLERKTGKHTGQIDVKSEVELELTAGVGVVAGGIHSSKGVGGILLGSSEQIFAIDNVIAVFDKSPRVLVGRIDCRDGNQRHQRIGTGVGGTHIGRLSPEIGAVLAVVVERCACVNPTTDPVIELQVNITAHVQTGGVIVLTLAEIHQV